MTVSVYLCVMATMVLATGTKHQWSYQDVMDTGKFCPERDSCSSAWLAGGGAIARKTLSWQTRNCFCDPACSMYGDCCIDADYSAEKHPSSVIFSCVPLPEYGLVYMRTQCSPEWPEGHVKTVCEDRAGHTSNPLQSIPVTSSTTGITYSSYSCAKCNKDTSQARFWQARLECPTLQTVTNITKEFVRDNLEYSETGQYWGVVVDKELHPCHIHPFLPPTLTHYPRPCPALHLNQSCPAGYPDNKAARLCQAYTGLVYSDSQGRPFRNIHCALCNKVNTESLICIKLEVMGRNLNKKFSNNFSIIYNISVTEDFGENRCTEQKIWDPFHRKCRRLICEDEKCQQEILSDSDLSSFSEIANISIRNNQALVKYKAFSTISSTTSKVSFYRGKSPSAGPTSNKTLSVNVLKAFDELDALFAMDETTISPKPVTPSPFQYKSKPPTTSTCPKILLPSNEFQLVNDSVHIPSVRQTLAPGQYWLTGDSVYICQPNTGTIKFSPMMEYITMVSLGLSIICLTFHIVISLIAPQLQNLSGKNLFSLSCALIGSHSTFLTNIFATEIEAFSCKVLAVSMYYFYMATFFWMLNIAFEVARTLKQANKSIRLTTGPEWGKFLLFSAFGWLFPGILVIATITLDYMEDISDIFKPGFGVAAYGLCWFSSREAVLIFFVIPFIVTMLINIIFFLLSAFLVRESLKSGPKITTSGPKINFYLNLRLSVLLSLTWLSGLVAGWLETEPAWYAFLVLNSFQGFFILVCFTCSKRIVISVKNRVCRVKIPNKGSKIPLNPVMPTGSFYSSTPGSFLTGSGARPFKYSASSYAQYQQYDQKF